MTVGSWCQTTMAIAASVFLTGVAPAFATSLQSHQAQYRLTPTELKMAGAVGASEGLLLIRIEERCTDWLIFSQLQITMKMENGSDLTLTSVSALEESKDSTELTFDSEIRFNDNQVEKNVGVARVPEAGAAGEIELRDAVGGTVTAPLPAGTYFPVATYWRSIGRIVAGEKVIDYVMYDGSGTTPVRATDVITGDPKNAPNPDIGDADLITDKGWRIITSFFDIDATDAQPTSTNIFEIYDNGVTGWVKYDIGLVEVDGVLTAIEALPDPVC